MCLPFSIAVLGVLLGLVADWVVASRGFVQCFSNCLLVCVLFFYW